VKILAGTSGYAFPEWKGAFYPEGTKSADFLRYYASQFPTVEINNTFYRLPSEKVIRDWGEQVPEEFSFSIKASQRITHFQRLKPESIELVEYLVRTTASLGDRLGPILFQLPPNMKKDADRLRAFLEKLPEGRRYAMEFRHQSWFDEDVVSALRDHRVAWVACDQDDFSSPMHATAPWGYVRLHRMDYAPEAIAEWARKISGSAWSEVYVYFKHDDVPTGGSGPPAVRKFVEACG